MKRVLSFLIVVSFAMTACLDGLYEDSCGNCWRPYCYDYTTHTVSYDIDEEDCNGSTQMWAIPSSDSNDPYFNNYCDGTCPDGFMADDCGHCWQSFCYTLFSPGLNGDGPHSAYYDLTQEECEGYGYGYYTPNNPSNPDWNSNCTFDCNGVANGDAVEDCAGVCGGSALTDDCGECQSAYCYD